MTTNSKLLSFPWAVDETTCDTSIALRCAPMDSLEASTICNSSKGLKRKRPSGDARCTTDLSSLSLESDPRLMLGLGVAASPSDSGSSTGSGTSSGNLLMKGADESPMESGLVVTRRNAHGVPSGCTASVTPGCGSARSSVESDIGSSPSSDQNFRLKTDVLLGLGRLQCSLGEDNDEGSIREGFGSASCVSFEKDSGTCTQLAKLGALTESCPVSGLPTDAFRDGRFENSFHKYIPIVDEGSTSGKFGGYMRSLLMGKMVDRAVCVSAQRPDGRLQFSDAKFGMDCAINDGALEADFPIDGASTRTTLTTGASGSPGGRPLKTCNFIGCGKGARGASGLCIAHGGGRRCQKPGCNKGAEGRTVYCKAHGGGPRCQSLGCTKSAEGKTDYCISHGGGRRCSQDGCSKAARGRSGLCIRHGGGKRCQQENCTKSAEGYSGLCISHGGGRRCQFPSCGKGAQGSTMFCKAHGGGKRCMIQGCTRGAEGRTPLCKGHGGGKRCMFDGGGVCTKSVHGGTSYCVAHGGGKRCAVQDCTKSARGKTDFCVRHGGGKRCKVENCTKSAQGSTDFCKAHGGGKRCTWGHEGCPHSASVFRNTTGDPLSEPCEKFARGKMGLCAAHIALVHDHRVHGAGTLGQALTSGIKPGLFQGLVSRSIHQVQKNQSRSDISKQSKHVDDDHADPDSDGGRSDPNMQACTSHSSSGMEDEVPRSQKVSHFAQGKHGNVGSLRLAVGCDLDVPKVEKQCTNKMNAGVSAAPVMSSANSAFPSVAPSQNTQRYVTAAKMYFPYFLHVPGIFGTKGRSTAAGSVLHRPYIPPNVLVPLFMQKGDVPAAQEKEKCKQTGDDGSFNMSSLSLPDDRVHGGNIMTLLPDEVGSSSSTGSQPG